MAISTYSELQTAVTNWLDRSDLSARVPEFIMLAEIRIGRLLRVRNVEERATTPLVAAQEYYALPSDFLSARNVQINTNPVKRLKYRTPEQMDTEYPSTSSGTPKVYTIIGDEIQIKPIPNSTDTLELAYFKKLAALSDTNTTNWLTANAPDLLLYGSLVEAEAYLVNDPRIGIWKTAFDEAVAAFNKQDEEGRYSGAVLVERGDGSNP